jgi:hypothetical protein
MRRREFSSCSPARRWRYPSRSVLNSHPFGRSSPSTSLVSHVSISTSTFGIDCAFFSERCDSARALARVVYRGNH